MRFLLLALVAFAFSPRMAGAQSSDDRIFPYDYHVRDLDNGLRVVVIPTDFPNIVSLQIPIATGSRNEVEEGRSGFAHFFEHMMFRGTENRTAEEYQAVLKNIGADQNAYTTDDRTVYHTTFSAEDLETMLELESDRFMNLAYAEPEFRTEALAVLGEYNKNSANPINKLIEVQRESAFRQHTYQHTTMGFLEDIEAMPEAYDYSLEFFRRYYRPENAAIVISGDVDPEEAFALVEQYFGAWEVGFEPVEVPQEPAPEGPVYEHVDWETETLPWVSVAFRGPAAYPIESNAAPGDMQALDVLAQYAFGASSDLYQRLVVEEQKVDQFFSYFPDRLDPYLLSIMARVKDPADVADVREAIYETIAELKTTTPDPTRIAEIKSALKYGFAAGMDNSEALADAVIPVLAATGEVETLNRMYAQYETITPGDVRRVANRYFHDTGLVVTTLAHGDLPAEAMQPGSVAAAVEGIAEGATPASEPIAVPRREAPAGAEAPAFEEHLRRSSSPLINVRFLFETGPADDPDGKEGLAELTARMVADAGSEALTYSEVQRALYPMAAGFNAQVDKEMTAFGGTVHRDNLDRYYDIIGGMLLDPGFRESDFERVKSQLLNEIRVGLRANNDEELGKEVLYEVLYGPEHPYGHLNLGHAEAVEALTLADVRAFYDAHYVQPALTVGIAGDVPEEVLARIRADIASELPREGGDFVDEAVPQAPMPDGLQVTLIDKDTRAAALSLGFPIDVRRGDEDWLALYLVRSYFGEHRSSASYLFQRIREIRGMNYGDYAYIEYFPRGMYQFHPDPNLGRQQQIFQMWIRPVPPEQAHFALRIALYELEKLVEEGLSEENFASTRNYLLKFTNVLTSTQGRALGYDLDSDYYGTPEFVEYVREGLRRLTLEDVNEAIREHLDTDGIAAVVITPDADSFAERLIADEASPMTYASEKPAEILAEDEVIARYPLRLRPEDVRVVDVEDVFERPVFD